MAERRRSTRLAGDAPAGTRGDLDAQLERLAGGVEIGGQLDQDLRRQPELYYRAARELTRALATYDQAVLDHRRTRAKVEALVRRVDREQETGRSEAELAGQVEVHADVVRASDEVVEARRRAWATGTVCRAFEQRASVLLALAQVRGRGDG